MNTATIRSRESMTYKCIELIIANSLHCHNLSCSHFCPCSYNYSCFLLIVPPVPQLSNIILFNITSSSIMVSWSPPQLTPGSYNVVYYCQFLCDSQQNTSTGQHSINGSITTHTISSLNAGSSCTVSVTAVFGSNTSNTVTNSTNTTSTGTTHTSDI